MYLAFLNSLLSTRSGWWSIREWTELHGVAQRSRVLQCNTKLPPVPPATLVMSPDFIRYFGWVPNFGHLWTSSLLCSPFILTLLIRKHHLVVLLFSLIVLHSQTYLRSKLRNSCYIPFWVIVAFMIHNRLIIFLFRRYMHSYGYLYERIMYDRISSYIDQVHLSSQTSSLPHLLQSTLEYLRGLCHS